MWRTGVVAGCFGVWALARISLTANAAPPVAAAPVTWATWITRDVQLDFHNLPKAYSCDELWYRLRDVLLAIGARQYMAITPYNCAANSPGGGRSPSVDLKFQTLRVLTGAEAHWAQTKAARKTVRLAPGEPKILDAADCALLSQLDGTLFTYLDMHVLESDLQCAGPASARKFSVVVDAVVAVPSGPPQA
jgi:hypothetical protein